MLYRSMALYSTVLLRKSTKPNIIWLTLTQLKCRNAGNIEQVNQCPWKGNRITFQVEEPFVRTGKLRKHVLSYKGNGGGMVKIEGGFLIGGGQGYTGDSNVHRVIWLID